MSCRHFSYETFIRYCCKDYKIVIRFLKLDRMAFQNSLKHFGNFLNERNDFLILYPSYYFSFRHKINPN